MASEVEICNRALQKIGADRIVALDQDSRNARACNSAYSVVRDAELRAHPWSFAIKRDSLAADVAVPSGEDFDRQFTLPTDCLRVLMPADLYLDWTIEGRKILTNDAAPVYLRYISRVEDPSQFDVLFIEALASRLAHELCEQITQSNSKKESARQDYKDAIREARRVNAIEKIADEAPEDPWIAAMR